MRNRSPNLYGVIALALGFLVTAAVNAAPKCHGTISNVWIDSTGAVFVFGSYRNDHTQICSVSGSWKGIAVDTCKGWVSMAQVAVASKMQVTVLYPDSAGITSCEVIPGYGSAPAPSYFMIRQ